MGYTRQIIHEYCRKDSGDEYAWDYINGLVQDCSNLIANALEYLQSCTKPSISMT